jgi:hypothetical protein
VCFQVLALIQSNPAYQRLYRRHAGPWYSHAEDGCHRMDRSHSGVASAGLAKRVRLTHLVGIGSQARSWQQVDHSYTL